jgi:hypothetical protein
VLRFLKTATDKRGTRPNATSTAAIPGQ